jgi:hypothetical protein
MLDPSWRQVSRDHASQKQSDPHGLTRQDGRSGSHRPHKDSAVLFSFIFLSFYFINASCTDN